MVLYVPDALGMCCSASLVSLPNCVGLCRSFKIITASAGIKKDMSLERLDCCFSDLDSVAELAVTLVFAITTVHLAHLSWKGCNMICRNPLRQVPEGFVQAVYVLRNICRPRNQIVGSVRDVLFRNIV